MKFDSERQTSYDIAYMQNLKKKGGDTNELTCRTETDSQILKNVWLPKGTGAGEGEGGLGFGDWHMQPEYMQ